MFTKILSGVFCIAIICLCFTAAPAYAQSDDALYLGGFPAGFVLNTQDVEVIGVCEVLSEQGPCCPARDCGIKSGDVIKKVNGKEIKSASELTQTLSEDYVKYELTLQRDNSEIKIEINPITDKNTGKKRFGLLVKDTINGIGTVTYIDKANNKFGSLGHPVVDTDGKLIQINGGSLYGCMIYDVKRGQRGNPGELKGIFDNSDMVGCINKNTDCGIFGDIKADYDYKKLTKIKKGGIADATIGRAYIYTTLDGSESKQYEISIIKVDRENKDNRNFVIKINDKQILDKSGGIVQGMSGSPIVQSGKLIGAVTHVFVNDPTRGYGIGLENMLNS